MTPHEERLVLELQSKWGNRWSRIARKLPGRTDNEIKNYWRTHMRKKAQDKKRNSSAPSIEHHVSKDAEETSFYDTGGSTQVKQHEQEEISMDDIWKDIDISEENSVLQNEEFCNDNANNKNNISWEYNSSNSLWVMDEESVLFPKSDDPYFSHYANY
ncbi:unnamed protein product [Lathyrus sativus]|nr:unnamed protein product [Lathyrus sativus]